MRTSRISAGLQSLRLQSKDTMILLKMMNRARRVWARGGVQAVKLAVARKLTGLGTWTRYSEEAYGYAQSFDFSPADLEANRRAMAGAAANGELRSITWFLPEFYHPFYGGVYTLLRFADYMKRVHGVTSRYVIVGEIDPARVSEMIGRAFAGLADSPVTVINSYDRVAELPATDAAVATFWKTAYYVLRFNQTGRKFYFIQDYEPTFYPAGATYAQVETTYRFGFYGVANTPALKTVYETEYGGRAEYFYPAVDTTLYHPEDGPRRARTTDTVFFYGRPDNPRNAFELGVEALKILKQRRGDRVRIVAAGGSWKPAEYGLEGVVENLGVMTLQETAALYRSCTLGLVMMFTRHPSYLPFELIASGALVVTNHNRWTTWLLEHEGNCLLAEPSATCLADAMERGITDTALHEAVTGRALAQIRADFSDWEAPAEKVFQYLRAAAAPAGTATV